MRAVTSGFFVECAMWVEGRAVTQPFGLNETASGERSIRRPSNSSPDSSKQGCTRFKLSHVAALCDWTVHINIEWNREAEPLMREFDRVVESVKAGTASRFRSCSSRRWRTSPIFPRHDGD
jgi:hypothetical protein